MLGKTVGWSTRYHPLARKEADAVQVRDRRAIDNAVDKLAILGPNLAFPHASKVMSREGGGLRELRPRAGRSSWRCIYSRIGDVFVILAICREAQHNRAAFDRGVRLAIDRMGDLQP